MRLRDTVVVVPRARRQIARTALALEEARTWLVTEIEHLRVYRMRTLERDLADFALLGLDRKGRPRDPIVDLELRLWGTISEVDRLIYEYGAILKKLGRRKTVRIPWRSLDALFTQEDDTLLVDATLQLTSILREAKRRFRSPREFKKALLHDECLADALFGMCHGLESVSSIPAQQPSRNLVDATLATIVERHRATGRVRLGLPFDEPDVRRYFDALRAAFSSQEDELRRVLAHDDVVSVLFGHGHARARIASGATKAAQIAIEAIAGFSPQSIYTSRRKLGLVNPRPMPRRTQGPPESAPESA